MKRFKKVVKWEEGKNYGKIIDPMSFLLIGLFAIFWSANVEMSVGIVIAIIILLLGLLIIPFIKERKVYWEEIK